MADHPTTFGTAASPLPPVPLIHIPLLPPGEPLSFDMSFNPSCQASVHAPTAVISICHRRKFFYMGPMPERGYGGQVTFLTPARSFRLPLSLLLDRSRWHNVASGILHNFSFSSEAYAQLLSHLCILGADWAEFALKNGCTRLDVEFDVRERTEIDFPPLFLVDPESMPPLEEASVGQNMKAKELSELAAGETCAVCFEEFGGSRKAVTETQCSHIFHTECLLPWLSGASTCPLCRSSLR